MARVWVVVLSVWAMLAIVAVLAWASHPVAGAAPQQAPQQVLVKGPNGKSHLVVLKSPVHATTATSAAVRP
jgi:cyanate permease